MNIPTFSKISPCMEETREEGRVCRLSFINSFSRLIRGTEPFIWIANTRPSYFTIYFHSLNLPFHYSLFTFISFLILSLSILIHLLSCSILIFFLSIFKFLLQFSILILSLSILDHLLLFSTHKLFVFILYYLLSFFILILCLFILYYLLSFSILIFLLDTFSLQLYYQFFYS